MTREELDSITIRIRALSTEEACGLLAGLRDLRHEVEDQEKAGWRLKRQQEEDRERYLAGPGKAHA